MSPLGSPSPLSLSAWLLHGIGVTFWVGGAVLLGAWAIRSLAPERLRSLGAWLLALGVVASLVAAASWPATPGGTSYGGMRTAGDPLPQRGAVAPDARSVTPPPGDTAPASPDHLMPDGSMMDSRTMDRMMGSGRSIDATSPALSAPGATQ